jgi:fermentation-respiration switch protein FrsA (DUF1100 family)
MSVLSIVTGSAAGAGGTGDIPFLTVSQEDAVRLPVVIFIHGYGGTKESGLSLGYRLAQRGFFFVSFDAFLHGERYDAKLDNAWEPERGGIYPRETGLDIYFCFLEVIAQCLSDVRSLLRHFQGDTRADLGRLGVTGVSMGGYASYLIFSRMPEVQAAVPVVGIPNFTRRWQDLLDETRLSNPAWGEALARVEEQTERRLEFVREIDPYPALLKTAPRALMMINGDFDTDQPKHYALDLMRDLLPAYRDHPESLRLNIYPTGHTFNEEMELEAVGWFEKHLRS